LGSFILAAAGVLDRRRAATRWSSRDQLAKFPNTIDVERNARIEAEDIIGDLLHRGQCHSTADNDYGSRDKNRFASLISVSITANSVGGREHCVAPG
jgi:hypothetical protein